jgi:2-iminobutanoate/2-iminopropanoate deaminase
MNKTGWLLLLALVGCASTRPQLQRSCFHQNESVETDIGFCQAIRSGRTLHISGVAAEGDMPSAIRSVYERLNTVLLANGLSFANVVKENVYSTDLDAFIQNKGIRKGFYGQILPAATWVQIQRLYLPSFVLEVELTAEYPD